MIKNRQEQERRHHVRADRALAIEHCLFKHKGTKVDGAWQHSTTKNMSLTGILFQSEIHYEPGDLIELKVAMSGILNVFEGFGRVVRVEKKSDKMYSVAVTLIDKNSKSSKILIN